MTKPLEISLRSKIIQLFSTFNSKHTQFQVIKARIKELQIPRFKVIALITIGSSNDQGMTVGSRCLWDDSVDMFSSYEFRNKYLFAVGTVYGIYTE